jgi:two-component system LytT family sensor kinase
MNPTWPRSVKIVVAFALVATFFATQGALVHVSRGAPIDWQWDVMHEFVYWLTWAGFAPLVLGAARRWPPSAVGPHLGLMALIAPVQISMAYLVHFTLLRVSGNLPAAMAGAWLAARVTGVVWGTFAGFLYYWMIAAVYWAAEFQRLYRAERLQAAQLEASLAAARLDALRAQLQPHFLFNTLNAISVLAVDDPGRAKQMVLRLSDLLRASMDGAEGHEVPLATELQLLNAYLEIQRARFGERLRVRLEIEPATRDALVPTLVLQPLVENAIRHGLEGATDGGEVAVHTRRNGEDLVIEVRDDGRGLEAGASAIPREGVGLANTKERLSRLYGDRQYLVLRTQPEGGVMVELVLPYHTA